MKLTVTWQDKSIEKDGVVHYVDDEDWTLTDTNVSLVVWEDTAGRKMFSSGDVIKQYLTAESEVSVYSTFFDAHAAKLAARQASYDSIDTRFYTIGALNRATNTYAFTPKSLSTIQTEQVAAIKKEANRLLAKTDWYVIRYFELGPSNVDGAVPAAVSAYRQQIRAASHTYCTSLLAAGDFNAAISVANVSWPAELDSNTYYLSE